MLKFLLKAILTLGAAGLILEGIKKISEREDDSHPQPEAEKPVQEDTEVPFREASAPDTGSHSETAAAAADGADARQQNEAPSAKEAADQDPAAEKPDVE